MAQREGETLLRSLIAAAAEHPQVGQRLRDSIIGTSLITVRLRKASHTAPNLTPDAPFDALAQALTGAIIVAALTRTTPQPQEITHLVDAILGRDEPETR